MLKGSIRAQIVQGELRILIIVSSLLEVYDNLNKTSLYKEFYYVYLDTNAYSMNEIGELTGNSVCTVRRHIRKFNELIEYEYSLQSIELGI